MATSSAPHATGYLFHELFMWHNPGMLGSLATFLEPAQHWEHVDTKRRFHSLLAVSGLLDKLTHLRPRPATVDELARVHDRAYIARIKALSDDYTKGSHTAGEVTTMAPGAYDIAALAAGGAIAATEAVLGGSVRNAYALVRPPGHHAERDQARGFCLFNNIAVAAAHAKEVHGLKRIAIVDYDVHHGNGTQKIFEEDDSVLFISLHQHNNYPRNSGYAHERGTGAGEGYTINVPLPPGSGSGAYKAAFERVVCPAITAFKPELILVSSGFDASFQDKLAAMILSSEDYRWMSGRLMELADGLCGGRLVMMHEGGYSEIYVPFCGLAAIEQLSGQRTAVNDPWLEDVKAWGYQDLQVHQDLAIAESEKTVELLRSKLAARG